MEDISRGLEWLSVGVLVAGFALTLVRVGLEARRGRSPRDIYRQAGETLGRGILVGLEILVAADLIRTVAVQPTLANVGVLGLIVIVRVVLSFALDVEIDGVLPWRKHAWGRGTDPRPKLRGVLTHNV